MNFQQYKITQKSTYPAPKIQKLWNHLPMIPLIKGFPRVLRVCLNSLKFWVLILLSCQWQNCSIFNNSYIESLNQYCAGYQIYCQILWFGYIIIILFFKSVYLYDVHNQSYVNLKNYILSIPLNICKTYMY